MTDVLAKLADALAPGWVGSTIGLVGILAAVVTYLFTRQRTVLAFSTHGIRLIGHKETKFPEGVTVQYGGENISSLTRSLVVLWNAGERTIAGSDIVSSDPLRVELGDGAAVLSATVAKSSRAAVAASLHVVSQDRVDISFEFLDAADGIVVDILHTGETRLPVITGTVRGLPAGPKNRGRVFTRRQPRNISSVVRSRRIFPGGLVLFGTTFTLWGLLYKRSPVVDLEAGTAVIRSLLAGIGLMYLGLGLTLLWLFRRRHPSALQIEDLE